MGQDRLKSQKDRARRGWNEAGDGSQPSFFDKETVLDGRTFSVALRPGKSASVGDKLLMQTFDGFPIITHGPQVIGDCTSPLPAMIDALSQNIGIVCVEVVQCNPLSETLEVTIK